MMRATTKFRYGAKASEVASRCNRTNRRYRSEDKSGGRTMVQTSRGFGDADASLSGFGKYEGRKWLAYSLYGLIMGKYSEL